MAAGYKPIEDFFVMVPQMLAGALVVPPVAYDGKMTAGWADPSSDNWNCVAAAFEGINHLRRNPTSRSLAELGDYIWFELTGGKGAGLGQREFGGEYTQHQFAPLWTLWLIWPKLAAREPAHFTPEREESLRLLLMAWLGWLGACGTEIRPKILTAAEESKPGPRVVKSSGKPGPLNFTVLNGERGFVFYKSARLIYLVEKGQNDIFEFFCRARELPLYGRIRDAAAKHVAGRVLVSPEQQARFLGAASSRLDDLDWTVGLMRGFKSPRCLPWIRVYDTGSKAQGVAKASSGSTAPCYATKIEPDGAVECLIIDTGDRAEADPGTCVVDDAAGTATARRNKGGDPPVTMRLPPEASLIWKLDTLPDGTLVTWRRDRGGSVPPAPAPTPSPSPSPAPVPGPPPAPPPAPGKADAFDWLANASADLAAVGDGFFCTVSPVVGRPHLFVLRKSDGARPFSTELLWRDEARQRISLVAECGYHEGEVGNIRTFWESGRPGIVWLPREIDREGVTRYRTAGQLVETAITEHGAPYRPDKTKLPPGQSQEAAVDADTELTHVGVTRQLGEDAAVLRRLDIMGDRSKPATRNREQYEIAFGRGAYGYVEWQSWEAGIHKRLERSNRVRVVAGPCRFYGVDPLDPELAECWMSTPGYEGALPNLRKPTRRPTATSSSGGGGGSKKKKKFGIGCLWLVASLTSLVGVASAILIAMVIP